MEADCWGLSMEEMDSLELHAIKQLAERRSNNTGVPSSSSSSTSASSSAALKKQHFQQPSPSKSSGNVPTSLHVKLFKEQAGGGGHIGVQTQYNKHLVAALKTVPGHEWDPTRKVWTFPEARLEEVSTRILSIPEVPINVEAVAPLVLPSCVTTHQSSGSQRTQHSSPLKTSQPSLHPDHLEPVQEEISLSPPELKVYSGSPQISPMKAKGSSLVVQIYSAGPDHVAARSPYNEKIKEACQSVSGRSWNAADRVWMFPLNKLDELVQVLLCLASPQVKVEVLPPLKVTVTASSSSSDQFVASQPSPSQTLQQSSLHPVNLPKFSVKLSLQSSGLIAAKCEYNTQLVAALRSIPKADWHPKERLWLFPVASLAEAETCLSSVKELTVTVEGLEPLVRRGVEATATVPDLEGLYSRMPKELESQLLPFQHEGVRFALKRGGRVLIADEMGLGKTLQAIAVVSCLETEWPVLIVVPSSLRLQWAASLQQWLHVRPVDITVVMSQSCGSNREGFNLVQSAGKQPVRLDGLFNIVSYDLVTKLSQAIGEASFKIIIADESHYLKNGLAKRTNACVPLLQKAKYAILLTGTPALSRPIELFKQLEALQPVTYKSLHEYGNRYCIGGNFGVYQGSSNLQELHGLVKATVMIRRLKRDVLSQLPQKRRQQVFIALDDKGIKQMRALFHELESIRRAIKATSEDEFERLKYSEKQLVNKIYTDSAVAKLPAVQDYLTTLLEADCKFLIFAHHQTMLDGIEEVLMKKKVGHIRIDGGTPQSARQALVTRFQETDSVRAAVLGIRAAGVGLTLTAASTVVFAEMSWTPGDLIQAEDRVHRIGQASSVNVYYLHAHDTIDDIIWSLMDERMHCMCLLLLRPINSYHHRGRPL
ncbi:hypothetical protein BDL97_11G012600 [Sphagnum fallax]|nr:hypothetical protein BDL97_11G012600 [Sphagnum fallax]